ncbi:hypothetical protein L596_028574 [Steinernema carpocapsae]|uniref:Cystatin domain-containing protein n=1 Tax=Steinernema carpocapsae TaxID=34508 RepID=A0A4U5LYV3_STECR|nr:hypothetical protein L596_028574 [Steinernema carpocapsae]
MNALPLLFFALILPLVAGKKDLVGGWEDQDPNDPQIKSFASQGLQLKGKSPNGLKIISARSQVVSGIKYDIKFTYDEGGNETHEIVLWSQPWDKEEPLKVSSFK